MKTIRNPSPSKTLPAGYTFACERDALPVRGKKAVLIAGETVLIVACDAGLYAVENRCPQTGRAITRGAVIDCAISVPTTGARYCLRTGRYLGGGQVPLPSQSLRVYPLCTHGDGVYVRV